MITVEGETTVRELHRVFPDAELVTTFQMTEAFCKRERISCLVAALSQNVPSLLITRGHGPVSHRNIGFARSVGIEDYIANPKSADDLKEKIKKCWDNRVSLRKYLEDRIPIVQETARMAFTILPEILEE